MLEIKSLKKNFVSKNKQGKNIEKAVRDAEGASKKKK